MQATEVLKTILVWTSSHWVDVLTSLANMYHRAGDYPLAIQYYKLAADQGNTNSQFKLGTPIPREAFF